MRARVFAVHIASDHITTRNGTPSAGFLQTVTEPLGARTHATSIADARAWA